MAYMQAAGRPVTCQDDLSHFQLLFSSSVSAFCSARSFRAPGACPVLLTEIRQLVNEPFALLPSETGIRDRTAVDAVADFLAAIFQITFDHQTFHQSADILRDVHAVEDVFGDPDLFEVLLAGVGVVAVDDHGRVAEIGLFVGVQQVLQILVVVVRMAAAEAVDVAAEDRVGVRVACSLDFPSPVDEFLAALGRNHRVHHHGNVAAGGVLHAGRDPDSTGHHAVGLVLHRAGADRDVAQEVREVAVVFRVEHLFRAGEAGLANDGGMHFPDRDDAGEHVFAFLGIRLMKHAFVAGAFRPGFVGVDAGDDEDPVADFLLYAREACHIVEDGILPVRRTGSDHEEKFVLFAAEDVGDLLVALFLDGPDLVGDGKFLLQLLRDRKAADEFHLHFHGLYLLSSGSRLHRVLSATISPFRGKCTRIRGRGEDRVTGL